MPRNHPPAGIRKNNSLIQLYSTFEQTINCTYSNDAEIARLPRFNGNKGYAIHRWFPFKEGFSGNLLTWVCQVQGIDLDALENILDPFCGVGTSLLSANINYRGDHSFRLVGIERNPFIAFVARSKLAYANYRIAAIRNIIPKLVDAVRSRTDFDSELPALTTIRNQNAFNRKKLRDLIYARELIDRNLHNSPERDFFLLGWASVIETASNLRKDGRMLRFVDKEKKLPVYQLLNTQWNLMLSDLLALRNMFNDNNRGDVNITIFEGDGRTLQPAKAKGEKFDFIIYSPPYLNNIDYSEVYKLELWLSGLVSSQEQFRNLRLSTLRSHPSIRFPETDHIHDLSDGSWSKILLNGLISSIPKDENFDWRLRLVRAYVDDMLVSLQSQYAVAKQGAHVVCVVGNSLHGRREKPIIIATDLIIAALARDVGFCVKDLQVSRQLYRRDHTNKLLRESIIILQRP